MNQMLDEIQSITGAQRSEAEQVLRAMVKFLGARLPSPVMGRIREALADETPEAAWQPGRPSPE